MTPTIDPVLAGLPALTVAVVVGLAARPSLRRLREPSATDIPPGETKTPYAALSTGRFALGASLVSFALGWISWSLLPAPLQPPWVVLDSAGVLLALVDLRTTWLPLQLTRLGWLLMGLAVALAALLTGDPWLLLRAASGAAAAAAIYWLVWAISHGGFGYGDVRFAPMIGAAAGSVSASMWIWALLLGIVVGGLVATVRLTRRRRGPFAYAPSMLLGGYLALAVSTLV